MIINCLNLDASNTQCVVGDVASTTNGFTYGEIINSSFFLINTLFALFVIFKIMTSGVKVYNKDYDI